MAPDRVASLIKFADRYGFPCVVLVFMGAVLWYGGAWTATKCVEPVVNEVVRFIQSTATTQVKIVEGQDRLADTQGKITENVRELHQTQQKIFEGQQEANRHAAEARDLMARGQEEMTRTLKRIIEERENLQPTTSAAPPSE